MKLVCTTQLLVLVLLSATAAYSQKKNTINKNTMTEQNKEKVRSLYEEVLNGRKLELLSDYVSEEFTGPGGVKGVAGFVIPVSGLIKAFPDVQWKLQNLIAEGDKVSVHWKVEGVQAAPFQFVPNTGKPISNEGMGIYEFKEGKIIHTQVLTDRINFLQQLNVLPGDLSTLIKDKSPDVVHFIDKFIVPENGKMEFLERVAINRAFIRTLPGFIEDVAYERKDETGNLIFITVATWQNMEAVQRAKEKVQEEYKRSGFDLPAMLARLNITIERAVYKEAVED